MARKTVPAHPARDRSRDDESLLLRSAESLGRMIGSLQRQLDIATGRLAGPKPDGIGRVSSTAKSSAKTKSRTSRASAESNPARARKKPGGTPAGRTRAKKR